MRLKNYTMLVFLSVFVFLAGCRSTTIAPTSIDYSGGKCASGYYWSNKTGCEPQSKHTIAPVDRCTSGYYWSNGDGRCLSKIRSHSSAERFCADIVKKYNKGHACLAIYTTNEMVEQSLLCHRNWRKTKAEYEELISITLSMHDGGVEGMSVKEQFKSCVFQKKKEQGDSDFLRYLDKY
jgi:hypothetical protein